MENSKKKWERPQLIILARGTPEENVLYQCKTEHGAIIGPAAGIQQSTCGTGDTTTNCGACQSRGGQSS